MRTFSGRSGPKRTAIRAADGLLQSQVRDRGPELHPGRLAAGQAFAQGGVQSGATAHARWFVRRRSMGRRRWLWLRHSCRSARPQLGHGQVRRPTFTATPGQAARLATANARAQEVTRQVRELDPTWRPTPSLSDRNNVEGAIRTAEAEARQAEARLAELARDGIGGNTAHRSARPDRAPVPPRRHASSRSAPTARSPACPICPAKSQRAPRTARLRFRNSMAGPSLASIRTHLGTRSLIKPLRKQCANA
jgi:hypothetical protein